MDWPVILIRITGVLLFLFTARSIYQHIKRKSTKTGTTPQEEQQSKTEIFLNHFILYVFLAFLLTFSIGMIVNN